MEYMHSHKDSFFVSEIVWFLSAGQAHEHGQGRAGEHGVALVERQNGAATTAGDTGLGERHYEQVRPIFPEDGFTQENL